MLSSLAHIYGCLLLGQSILKDLYSGSEEDGVELSHKAADSFNRAISAFQKAQDWANYALVHANMAKMIRIQVAKGIESLHEGACDESAFTLSERTGQGSVDDIDRDPVVHMYKKDWRLLQYHNAIRTCARVCPHLLIKARCLSVGYLKQSYSNHMRFVGLQGLQMLSGDSPGHRHSKQFVSIEQAAAYLSQGVYIKEHVNSSCLSFEHESKLVEKALEMMGKSARIYEALQTPLCREPAATAHYHLGMGLSRCVQSKQREKNDKIFVSISKGSRKSKDGEYTYYQQQQRLQVSLPLRHLEKALEFFNAKMFPTDHIRIRCEHLACFCHTSRI